MAPAASSSSSSSIPRGRPQAVQIASLARPKRTQDFNGDDNEYIMQCAHSCDGAAVAASLSNREIKVYDRASLAPKGVLSGHAGPITSLCWSPDEPAMLASSSEDKTVRIWDTRQGRQAAAMQQDDEALSCAIALQTGLLAVGVGDHIKFFDVRKPSAPLGHYADAHTDLVTKVLFHPTQPAVLASGSEDGLLCMYNTAVAQADEALSTIINAECAVRDFTFFGAQGDGLAVLTGSEGASVWHWPSARRAMAVEDLRQACQGWASAPQFAVQYHYDGAQGRDRLLLSTSDTQGRVTLLEVQPRGGLIPILQLEAGHEGLVRSVDFAGNILVTGGEDARLCLWSLAAEQGLAPPATPPSTQAPQQQAGGALKHKTAKHHHHHHHHHHKHNNKPRQQGGGGGGGVRYMPY